VEKIQRKKEEMTDIGMAEFIEAMNKNNKQQLITSHLRGVDRDNYIAYGRDFDNSGQLVGVIDSGSAMMLVYKVEVDDEG
jgi:hypothetical protein